MGLFSKKEPCAICGGKVGGLFPSKIEGQYICKDCYGNVDVSDSLPPMTMEQFKAYRRFREENGQLRERFHTTEHIDFGFFGADVVFDRENRWFCLDPNLNRTIFEGSAVRSFTICEDSRPLFSCDAAMLRRYESSIPEEVRGMAPMILQYRMQMEMQHSLERMANDRQRNDPNSPPPPPPHRPHMDLPEPMECFVIEIRVEHPYWRTIRLEKKAPTFSNIDPDVGDYMREYQQSVTLMERLALALKEVAFPDAAEQYAASGSAAATIPTVVPADTVEEIRKYKALLDQQLITEVEFAAKKRQLLGI